MIIKLPYQSDRTNGHPVRGAIAISRMLKEEFNLIHGTDFKWYWETNRKNLVIDLAQAHESMASYIALRFAGADLYELR
jgi:plasmid rolling circle replication initiator protein Rep